MSDQYLESKVLTASQPELQLMLLDGAVRIVRQARDNVDSDAATRVELLLGKALSILDELVHSVANRQEEISRQLEEQYVFIYRQLTMCRIDPEVARLEKCLKLLEYQRDTWRQVCESTVRNGKPHRNSFLPLQESYDATELGPGFSIEA